MSTLAHPSINPSRFWGTVERSDRIGVGRSGGLKRVALSDDDKLMRDQFVTWCKEAGYAVSIDRVGSIFARRAGENDALPPVVIGSHLDTQVNGGRYDGVLGVLAGLEVLRTLDDQRIRTNRSIEVVSWTNEEGARFSPPMVAAGAFAGVYPVDWVLGLKDDDGIGFGDELRRLGYDGGAAVGGRPLDAYFELHIEQGPALWESKIPVGIVTKGYAVRGLVVEVQGETAHTGPWPMDKRKNALVGAAMLAVAINDIGWKYHSTAGKATPSRLVAWPNKPGILSDWAQVTCDFRHIDPQSAEQMKADMLAQLPALAKRANVEFKVVQEWLFGNERFDPECISLLRETSSRLGVDCIDMASQAGHDAYHVSKVAPTAMIFTPCRDGITHNNNEFADLESTMPGVNVLLNAVLARANR
ncbi:MAG: Zn-dependent hydrolase [Burkholderiales bacterium]